MSLTWWSNCILHRLKCPIFDARIDQYVTDAHRLMVDLNVTNFDEMVKSTRRNCFNHNHLTTIYDFWNAKKTMLQYKTQKISHWSTNKEIIEIILTTCEMSFFLPLSIILDWLLCHQDFVDCFVTTVLYVGFHFIGSWRVKYFDMKNKKIEWINISA